MSILVYRCIPIQLILYLTMQGANIIILLDNAENHEK